MTAPLKPGDFLRDHGIEISDSVAADFHMILAAFIAEGVAKMAAFGNGYPPDLTFEGWQEICAEIVAGFRRLRRAVGRRRARGLREVGQEPRPAAGMVPAPLGLTPMRLTESDTPGVIPVIEGTAGELVKLATAVAGAVTSGPGPLP